MKLVNKFRVCVNGIEVCLNVEFFEGMFGFKYGFFCFCLMGLEFFFFLIWVWWGFGVGCRGGFIVEYGGFGGLGGWLLG